VRVIRPTKMEDCWVMRIAAKVSPMMRPRYLPRSPMSIFKAMRYIQGPPRMRIVDRERTCGAGVMK